jgi:hypothetical protein
LEDWLAREVTRDKEREREIEREREKLKEKQRLIQEDIDYDSGEEKRMRKKNP